MDEEMLRRLIEQDNERQQQSGTTFTSGGALRDIVSDSNRIFNVIQQIIEGRGYPSLGQMLQGTFGREGQEDEEEDEELPSYAEAYMEGAGDEEELPDLGNEVYHEELEPDEEEMLEEEYEEGEGGEFDGNGVETDDSDTQSDQSEDEEAAEDTIDDNDYGIANQAEIIDKYGNTGLCVYRKLLEQNVISPNPNAGASFFLRAVLRIFIKSFSTTTSSGISSSSSTLRTLPKDSSRPPLPELDPVVEALPSLETLEESVGKRLVGGERVVIKTILEIYEHYYSRYGSPVFERYLKMLSVAIKFYSCMSNSHLHSMNKEAKVTLKSLRLSDAESRDLCHYFKTQEEAVSFFRNKQRSLRNLAEFNTEQMFLK